VSSEPENAEGPHQGRTFNTSKPEVPSDPQSGAETPGARVDLGLNRFTTDPDALANEASADDAADGRIDLGLGSFDTAPQTDGE
jgi:hypothetical protein